MSSRTRVSAPAASPPHEQEEEAGLQSPHSGGSACHCLPTKPILTKTGTPRAIDRCARIVCPALLEGTRFKVPFGRYKAIPEATRVKLEAAFAEQAVSGVLRCPLLPS
jgi:hypothetical protein